MKPLKKEHLPQEVYDLYDKYAHNKLDRRNFVKRLSAYAVGGLTVPSILSFIMPDYKTTQEVAKDGPRLTSEYVLYKSPKGAGEMRGLLTRPKNAKGKLPGVIVVHENRGLNPYIEDVARRAALEGFIAFAPDALYPLGGYPGNDDEGRTLQRQRDRGKMLEDFISAYNFLKMHTECSENVGVVGFCFGGSISNLMAVHVPDLKAAVPFYGGQAPVQDVPKINAPLLLQFAELDKRVNAGWPAYEAALKEHGKTYTAHMYEGANHGFHNNTTPRYDEKNAKLAWERTIAFFNKHLK